MKALLEVVQLGGKNLEIAVMSRGKPMRMLALVIPTSDFDKNGSHFARNHSKLDKMAAIWNDTTI